MKNITNEIPWKELHGRPMYSTKFVEDKDINNMNVLDIGCGFGWMILNALDRHAKKICGIELTEEDLAAAKNNIKDQRVELKTGSAIDLPYENNTFGTVVSWEVIEHIPISTENQMFKEVNRVLSKNGVFYLSTPCNSFISKILDPAWWLIRHRHYSLEQMQEFAERDGFIVNKCVINGGWWEIIGINDLYIAKWIFRRKSFFKNFIDTKQDKEYLREKGFTNIFVKFTKF